MKKRVRIYKKGGQSNAPTQEQIYKHIADRMSAEDYDGDADTILQELTQVGIDPQTADSYITEVGDYLEQNNSAQSAEQEQLSAEEAQAQAEEEQATIEAQNAAEEEARKAQLYAMYNTDTEETTQDDNADEEIIMRQGGSKPSKRSFINQYTKLAKRQQGGNTPSPGADDVLGGREEHVSNFFKGIGESVTSAQQKQAAEEQYNAIYGNPQVGAYAQDGGIQQEQIDTESPLDHWSKQGAATRHIFSDNMYTQNDVAALEQYGGNTGQGLYKFIGGGDNESADEQYQDSDLDYQRYAKRGGTLNKYQDKGEVKPNLYNPTTGVLYTPEELAANKTLADKELADKTATPTDTEDYKKKYNELINQNTTDAQKQQQMMQQYMMQQYMQQMGNQGMFRSPIISRGEQYNKAVGSPYYTQSGERYTGPDLAGRLPSSVNVDKYGIFGRPKKMTYNYGDNENSSSTVPPLIKMPENGESEDAPYRGKTFGERLGRGMVNTKIPGIQQLGAKLIPSNFDYDGSNNLTESSRNSPLVTSNEPYYPPMSPRAQRRENRDDRQLNRFLGNNNFTNSNPESEFINTPENQKQIDQAKKIEALAAGSTNSNLSDDQNAYQDFLIRHQGPAYKEYGGPIDYTQYAYGGDISVPELYRAQVGTQVAVDPNANNMSFANLQGFFAGTGAVDAEGNTVDATLPESMQVDNITIDPNQPNRAPITDTPEGVSQKFRNKQAWDIDKAGIGDLSLLAANAFANTADEVRANRQENQMLENITSAETNFGINNTYDQGDYDPNSGLFRPNKMGFNGVSKYGGGVYAMGGNTEDENEDTQYMTQEEIDDFIANGGELEYL
jgi:hypothetical protein